ncbi:hypothetical protein BH10ACT1_BH10ACT1_22870 [soil metagenome]
MSVIQALKVMADADQAIGFVAGQHSLVGVVTFEDLGFAWDWAGPAASVTDAMTLAVVEVGPQMSQHEAAEAFSTALRAWTVDRASS